MLITVIHFLAAASPGPDFVLVSAQTLQHGKRVGILTAFGITLGLAVHIIYSALGLAAIMANSVTIMWGIKILGASYLIFLGIKGLMSKASANLLKVDETKQVSSLKTLSMGFLCNALNPKAPIYFIALFTLVLSPSMPAIELAFYGLWMMLIQLTWFSLVVFLFSHQKVNQQFQKMGYWLDRVFGMAMILLGVKVLLSKIN